MRTIVLFEHEFDELLTVLREAGRDRVTLAKSGEQFGFEHGYHARAICHLLETLNPKLPNYCRLPPPGEPDALIAGRSTRRHG